MPQLTHLELTQLRCIKTLEFLKPQSDLLRLLSFIRCREALPIAELGTLSSLRNLRAMTIKECVPLCMLPAANVSRLCDVVRGNLARFC